MICDFCSSENPRYCYTTAKIAAVVPGTLLAMGYSERWTACEICAKFIDKKDMNGLVQRAMETFVLPLPIPDEERRAFLKFSAANLRGLYTEFFAHLSEMRRMCLEEAERPANPLQVHTIVLPGGAS